jgi:predicted O-linked N-acetylglucosamine transferase (SPINDLY family)
VTSPEPADAEALANLGVLALQQGHAERALEWLTRARHAAPNDARIVAQLGVAQKQNGLLAQAISSYERALELEPSESGVWVNLGRAQRESGQLDSAIGAFRRALELEPSAPTWSMSSNALREAGRHDEAERAARAALGRDPWLAEAHLNQGAALHLSGQIAAALVSYFVASLFPEHEERARANLALALSRPLPDTESASPRVALVRSLLLAPTDAASLRALAHFEENEGRSAVAILCLERALELSPDPLGHSELARLLWEAGWHSRAENALHVALASDPTLVEAYRLLGAWFCTGEHRPSTDWNEAFERCPDDAVALAKLGGAAQRLGHPLRATALYQRLALLRPAVVESHLYLGTALTEQGLFTEASRAFERALALAPSRWDVFSSLLFALHLDPGQSPEALRARHLDFGAQLELSLPRLSTPAPRARASGQKLRVGYVSPDLCAHPISYFLEPVLREHDRNEFEIRCYSDVKRPDGVTARLSGLTTEFIAVNGWSHERLYERVRADGIDILVDLAGHTAGNRLPVFARKPAPVQVSWLGYFDTTGLAAIDYRIADEHSVPHDAEPLFSERVVRLPRSANCYLPPQGPPPAPPPCLESGQVSFGCFNNPAKVSQQVCRLYARILHAVPRSRLAFKYRAFNDPALRRRYLDWFEAEEIAPERIHFEGSSPVPEFLAALSRIDIALDPFPYSGETTALHTLWMGVPLVALAESEERYLEIATALARDPSRLAALRPSLRKRLAESALLDHRGVTRELEQAYRWMLAGGRT